MKMPYTGPMSLAEFLNHDPNGRGRTNYLRGWNKRQPPQIDVWLHTRAPWTPLWQHGGLQQVREIEDRETKVKRRVIWSLKWNCLEPESILKAQYDRDRTTGERTVAPSICPICKMNEYLYQLHIGGQLELTQPIFDFVVEEAGLRETLHLGAMIGEFPKWAEMPVAMQKAVTEARINLKDSWKHKTNAKCNYVFSVVDHVAPQNGCQVAIETGLLGQKVKSELQKELERRGSEEGNPLLNPYPFRWKFFAQEQEFSKKYDAVALSSVPITEDIHRLIVHDEPPDLSRVCRPGDVRSLRSQLEQYAVLELPFDDFFAEAEAMQAKAADSDTEFPYGANTGDEAIPEVGGDVEAPAPEPEPAPAPRRPAAPAPRAPVAAPAARAPAPAAPPAKPAAPAPRSPAPAARTAAPAAPPAKPAAPAPKAPPAASKPAAPAAKAPPAKPAPVAQGRTRLKEPEKPAMPPGWDPCVDCGAPMAPTMIECPGCGTRYAPVDGAEAAAPAAEEAPVEAEGVLVEHPEAGEATGDEIPW